ncbi:MAG: guanylate kinase [Candidatus Bipolaricaulia bacterium]
MSPVIFVLSGPSGVGKTTIVRAILQQIEGLEFSISCTTRSPRPGEREGQDYYFVSPERFAELAEAGEFLEHMLVYGHRYGTLRSEVERHLARGRSIILDIDTQGAREVRRRGRLLGLPLRFIFILPPSKGELRRRITERGSELSQGVEQRFRAAWREIEAGEWFDYLVVNRDLRWTISWAARLIQLEQG